jgi:hypothetical protein
MIGSADLMLRPRVRFGKSEKVVAVHRDRRGDTRDNLSRESPGVKVNASGPEVPGSLTRRCSAALAPQAQRRARLKLAER